ncbi:MAG: hypothetical protein EOO43_19660 [Flavobacterium sp.]|nr:MAG: hypothetical protein EOO43_19660 [Flavobacterium sp.]
MVNNDTQLYTNDLGIKNPYGEVNPQTRGYNGTPLTYVNNNGANQPCGVIAKNDLVKTNTPCFQYNSSGSAMVRNGNFAYTTAGYTPCPIDDYIPLIILAISGLGFFYLQRIRNLIPVIR